MYLDPIRYNQTNVITTNVADTMKFLRESYGEMSVDELEEETNNIKQYTFDLLLSIDLLLTKVQTHSEICSIAGAPMTDKQITDLAYLLIIKTSIYRKYLIEWNEKPVPKTWNDFKLHMRKAHASLKKVKGLTIKESSRYTSETMISALKDHQSELLQQVEDRCNEKFVEMIIYTTNQNKFTSTFSV